MWFLLFCEMRNRIRTYVGKFLESAYYRTLNNGSKLKYYNVIEILGKSTRSKFLNYFYVIRLLYQATACWVTKVTQTT